MVFMRPLSLGRKPLTILCIVKKPNIARVSSFGGLRNLNIGRRPQDTGKSLGLRG